MVRKITLTLCMLAGLSAFGQTSYDIQKSECGLDVDNPATCLIELTAKSVVGVNGSMRLSDTLLSGSSRYSGSLAFSTVAGAEGYLGPAVIYWSVPEWGEVTDPISGLSRQEVTFLTIYFTGTYAPASGGGTYYGEATIHFTYQRRYSLYSGWQWIRTASAGALKID